MSRARKLLLIVLATPLIVVALVSTAWAIDRSNQDGLVMRGVQVAHRDVSGKSEAELKSAIDELQSTMASTTVTIDAGAFAVESTAAELGISVDASATSAAVMEAGRHDPGPLAPLRWVKSLVADRNVDLRLSIDQPKLTARVAALEGPRRTTPVEPTVKATDAGITLVPGAKGTAIDISHLLGAIPTQVGSATETIAVSAPRIETPPAVSDETIAKLATAATTTTSGEITLKFGDRTKTIDGALFRPGFRVVLDGVSGRLDLDPAFVKKIFDQTATTSFNPTGVTFNVVGGVPVPSAGADSIACCSADAPRQITAGLLAGTTTIDVDPVTITAAEGLAAAQSLGINSVIGEFTTKHPAGQPRVKNIHRIADITRGAVIAPGATFSVNDFVGRRTVEKGFVTAPVIEKGEFSEDVGGGVSQFATTFFNAAFFGGLDIPDHKAHSIYISRYPFGREATLAYPSVDLKVTNNTPYGVLLWPTYTNSTLTVQLFSTRYATGVQQSVTPPSGCGRVTVVRARTFVDGRTDSQNYRADYNCNPPAH